MGPDVSRYNGIQPAIYTQLEAYDFATRLAALKLVRTALSGPEHWHVLELDDLLASDHLRSVVDCLSSMAVAGFLEIYGGWDEESADIAILREITLAEDLTGEAPADG
jgi:hypothetical protein